MALKIIGKLLRLPVLYLVLICQFSDGQIPWAPGHSLGNMGTIICSDGVAGRQLSLAASMYSDTFDYCLSVSAIDYYNAFTSFETYPLYALYAGGLISKNSITVKGNAGYFSALGIYGEQDGFLSVARKMIHDISLSVELRCKRAMVQTQTLNDSHYAIAGGLSLWVPSRFVCAAVTLQDVTVRPSGVGGFDPVMKIRGSLHTVANRYGAHGAVIELSGDESESSVNVILGHELPLSAHTALHGAVAFNPFIVSFGMVIEPLSSTAVSVALVNHTKLGWTRGVTMDYLR